MNRDEFEYQAGEVLKLPTSIIKLARKGDGYDHAFDSMNIMRPLNSWWHGWKKSRAVLVVELPSWGDYDTTQQIISEAADRVRAAGITVKEQ